MFKNQKKNTRTSKRNIKRNLSKRSKSRLMMKGGAIEIIVKSVDSKTVYKFSVQESDTILSIKQKIEQKEGLSPDRQRLIFATMQLDNDNTVNMCHITNGSTLILVRRNFDHLQPPQPQRIV